MEQITYRRRRRYKYTLESDYTVDVGIQNRACSNDYLSLDDDGMLTIKAGYSWDGASGPAIDTRNFMRGSLVHDALYQMLRERLLPVELREVADQVLRRICLEDGMSRLRAWWVYRGVRSGGHASSLDDLRTAP